MHLEVHFNEIGNENMKPFRLLRINVPPRDAKMYNWLYTRND